MGNFPTGYFLCNIRGATNYQNYKTEDCPEILEFILFDVS